jgi:hypothetical protein
MTYTISRYWVMVMVMHIMVETPSNWAINIVMLAEHASIERVFNLHTDGNYNLLVDIWYEQKILHNPHATNYGKQAACSFGLWLVACAGIFWEKSIVGWLLMVYLFWENSTAVLQHLAVIKSGIPNKLRTPAE